MDEVAPGVYVGDIEWIRRPQALEDAGVRFLLSIYDGELPALPSTISNHLQVPVHDEDSADLLSWFDRTNAFIQQARDDDSAVLVHCVAGVSRSAAVAMAHIMTSQQLTCPKAFRVLKKAHRSSCPNEGFRKQLKIFEAMGFVLDDEHPEYRLYRLQHAVDINFGSLGEIPLAPNPASGSKLTKEYQMLLQCRKCRYRVAVDRNILDHEPGAGQVAFRWRRRSAAEAKESLRCSSLFVEPMAWMAPLVEEGHLQGKLCCPNCSSRFGNFNWAGLQCSCGCWVTPAFQVNVSRIDCMPPPAPLPKPPSLAPPPADVAVAQPANAAEAEGVAQVTDSVAAVTLSAPTGQ